MATNLQTPFASRFLPQKRLTVPLLPKAQPPSVDEALMQLPASPISRFQTRLPQPGEQFMDVQPGALPGTAPVGSATKPAAPVLPPLNTSSTPVGVMGGTDAGTYSAMSQFEQKKDETPAPEAKKERTIDDILAEYGITKGGVDSMNPATSFADTYKQIYQSLGLPDIKAQFDTLTKDYQAVQDELAGKVASVNENPWIPEGTRQKRINALQEQYATKANNLVNRLDLLQGLMTRGTQEAQFVAEGSVKQGERGYDLRRDLALKAIEQAQKEAEAERKLKAPISLSQGEQIVDPTTGKVLFAGTPKLEGGIVGEYQFYAKQETDAKRKPLSFNDYQTLDANRKARIAGAGVASGTSPLVMAVLANPELFNQLTPTEKARLIPALNAAGFTAFGKPLSDTAIKEITQSETAIEQLNDLKAKIAANQDKIGPISGLAAINPYSDARKIQADIDRVKQTVGKTLEGGVLRKEDEEKYKKILATITDTPDTALYKVNQLIGDVQRQVDSYKKNQSLGGRNVNETTAAAAPVDQLRQKYNY